MKDTLVRQMITKKDLALVPQILKYTGREQIPLSFKLGGKEYVGIPKEFAPTVRYELVNADVIRYTVEGKNPDGLFIRAEYTEYRDFPVTEWLISIKNEGEKNTEILTDVRVGGEILCKNPVIKHGNGETYDYEGYSFTTEPLDKKMTFTPSSGTSCQGALPYYTFFCDDCEIRAAIGWPTKWVSEIAPTENGFSFVCGQERCHMVLRPGEKFQAPRITFMAYTPENSPFRGINIWRHWFMKHLMPKEDGRPVPPKLFLHLHQEGGMPEFTGATEVNQIKALHQYIERGTKPDVWWIDAGWYLCDGVWRNTGTWEEDFKRFPNGLGAIGDECEKEGVDLLLWFEPERLYPNTELDREHPEWVLTYEDEEGNTVLERMLDFSKPECVDWMIERVDSIIKRAKVKIYRQDFNIAEPMTIWKKYETEDRIGAMENMHAQGYLRYWDELVLRNPTIWIDSCASGGRRNDLENMRRAIPVHPTDIGYGHHPMKQKQYRYLLEWTPYFRSHNKSWDNPKTGEYVLNKDVDYDIFSYYTALVPGLTSVHTYNDTEEHFENARKMIPIWRAAAELELSGDFYPMTECRMDSHDWYGVQFDDADAKKGFVHALTNPLYDKGDIEIKLPCVHDGKSYTFTEGETGETMSFTSEQLKNGFTVSLPKRTGKVWFYEFD